MVLAGGPLRIYSSQDLKNWQVETTYKDLHTECPDFYPIVANDGALQWSSHVAVVLTRLVILNKWMESGPL